MEYQHMKDMLKQYIEEGTEESLRDFYDAAFAYLSEYCTHEDEIEKFLDNTMYPELEENMDFDVTLDTIKQFAESFV